MRLFSKLKRAKLSRYCYIQLASEVHLIETSVQVLWCISISSISSATMAVSTRGARHKWLYRSMCLGSDVAGLLIKQPAAINK